MENLVFWLISIFQLAIQLINLQAEGLLVIERSNFGKLFGWK